MEGPWKKALYVIDTLERKGHRAYVVGGAVRDLLLCRRPVDIDIATSTNLEEVALTFPNAKIVGKGRLQSATISMGTSTIDVVSFTDFSLREELKRRDFTINSMAMDSHGKIIDLWGGFVDLCAKQIRFTQSPKDRIFEDPVRIIRAARMASTLPGFTLDEESYATCRKYAHLLDGIPPERVGKEVLRALAGKTCTFIKTLEALGALKFAIPPLHLLKEIIQDPTKHPEGNAYIHSLLCLKHMEDLTSNPLMKAAALFHDLGKGKNLAEHEKEGAEMAKNLFKSWAWPQKFVDEACSLIEWHWVPFNMPQTKKAAKLTLQKGPSWMEKLFLLGYTDTLAGSSDVSRYLKNREQALKLIFNLRFRLPLSGKDILKLYPSLEGKKVGEILGDLAERIAEEGPLCKAEAAQWIKNKYGSLK